MNKNIITLFLIATASFAQAQSYTFLTYNIRYDNPGDGPDRWIVAAMSAPACAWTDQEAEDRHRSPAL